MGYISFNGTLCISGSELIISDKNPNGILSLSNYSTLQKRKRINVLRRGCCGSPALIEFDSLPQKYRTKWIEQNGKPTEINLNTMANQDDAIIASFIRSLSPFQVFLLRRALNITQQASK